jgi:hypothetical protein
MGARRDARMQEIDMTQMKLQWRQREAALLFSIALLFSAACDRLPPGGLFANGSVDEATVAARSLEYLQVATASVSTGSVLNAVAHMAREEQDPGYVAPAGAFGPNAWDAVFTKLSTFEDTSDFDALYLMTALLGYRDNPAVDAALWQKVEDALLAFKFWYTQPTPPGITDDMWYWSENHQIIFHSLEYLLGQTFPDRTFTTTGMTGAEHMAHARPFIVNWFDHKSRFGFDEWHSNVYYQKDVTPLLTLAEFAQDPEIANGAAILLDRFLLDIALNSFRGTFGATHGRTYKKDKMTAFDEDTYALSKLLFDTSPDPYRPGTDAGATLVARAKKYRLPQVILDIAHSEKPFVNRERMGIPLDEFAPLTMAPGGGLLIDETGAIPPPPGPYGLDFRDEANLPIFWSMSALTAWQVLPMVYEAADTYGLWESDLFQPFLEIRDAVGTLAFAQIAAQALPHAASAGLLEEVNTYSYRTPEYLLSSAQDYRKGSRGNQYHSWQATFSTEALVFTTHPGIPPRQTLDWNNDGEPGSWTGTASQPRTAQHENVAIHLYAPQYTVAPGVFLALTRYEPYTHAYFPQDHFDEVVRDGNWTFGRLGSGYIALYSWRVAEFVDHGPNVAKNGMALPFDLVAAGAPDNVWIVECGSESESGSFAAFQNAIRNAAISVTPVTTGLPPKTRAPFFDVSYQSPSQGAMHFSWTGPLSVDGEEVAITDYPRMDNPWAHIEFLDQDLFVENFENGAALWHDLAARRRFLYRVE